MESQDVAGIERSIPGSAEPRTPWRWHWLVWSVVIVAVASTLAAVGLWWQERPLRTAERELQAGDPQRALALVSYFLDSHPEHSPALALKARVLSTSGRASEAIELYEKIGAATAEDLHAWARAYLVRQAWSRALPLLTQVLRMAPDNADAWYEITSCRIRLGLLQEALESAERLSRLPDQQARGLVLIAAIQNDLGHAEASIKAYQQTIEASPKGTGLQIPPAELFLQYGIVLVNQGRGQEAVPWLERSLAARPTSAAYFHLGNAHAQARRREVAGQAWQKAVALDPQGSFLAREALANLALETHDTEAALRWIAPIERLADQRFKTAYLFQRVYMLRKDEAAVQHWHKKADELRQRDQRRAVVDDLVRRSPRSFWANVVRAHDFAASGNWQQAEDMLKELARAAPQDEFVQDLATAVRRRGPLPSLDRLPIRQF